MPFGACAEMDNRDKDYRYMACSDLNTELSKVGLCCQPDECVKTAAADVSPVLCAVAALQDTYQMGEDDEHRMCDAVIKALGDSATEVQGVAVKW